MRRLAVLLLAVLISVPAHAQWWQPPPAEQPAQKPIVIHKKHVVAHKVAPHKVAAKPHPIRLASADNTFVALQKSRDARNGSNAMAAVLPKAATTTPPPTTTTDPLAVLQQFTVTDLQAALTDAQAQTPPDTLAITCYSALIPIVQSAAVSPLPSVSGAFSVFQKARDTKSLIMNLQSPNGPLASLNVACAPLIMDTQNTLLALGAAIGIAIPKLPIPIP